MRQKKSPVTVNNSYKYEDLNAHRPLSQLSCLVSDFKNLDARNALQKLLTVILKASDGTPGGYIEFGGSLGNLMYRIDEASKKNNSIIEIKRSCGQELTFSSQDLDDFLREIKENPAIVFLPLNTKANAPLYIQNAMLIYNVICFAQRQADRTLQTQGRDILGHADNITKAVKEGVINVLSFSGAAGLATLVADCLAIPVPYTGISIPSSVVALLATEYYKSRKNGFSPYRLCAMGAGYVVGAGMPLVPAKLGLPVISKLSHPFGVLGATAVGSIHETLTNIDPVVAAQIQQVSELAGVGTPALKFNLAIRQGIEFDSIFASSSKRLSNQWLPGLGDMVYRNSMRAMQGLEGAAGLRDSVSSGRGGGMESVLRKMEVYQDTHQPVKKLVTLLRKFISENKAGGMKFWIHDIERVYTTLAHAQDLLKSLAKIKKTSEEALKCVLPEFQASLLKYFHNVLLRKTLFDRMIGFGLPDSGINECSISNNPKLKQLKDRCVLVAVLGGVDEKIAKEQAIDLVDTLMLDAKAAYKKTCNTMYEAIEFLKSLEGQKRQEFLDLVSWVSHHLYVMTYRDYGRLFSTGGLIDLAEFNQSGTQGSRAGRITFNTLVSSVKLLQVQKTRLLAIDEDGTEKDWLDASKNRLWRPEVRSYFKTKHSLWILSKLYGSKLLAGSGPKAYDLWEKQTSSSIGKVDELRVWRLFRPYTQSVHSAYKPSTHELIAAGYSLPEILAVKVLARDISNSLFEALVEIDFIDECLERGRESKQSSSDEHQALTFTECIKEFKPNGSLGRKVRALHLHIGKDLASLVEKNKPVQRIDNAQPTQDGLLDDASTARQPERLQVRKKKNRDVVTKELEAIVSSLETNHLRRDGSQVKNLTMIDILTPYIQNHQRVDLRKTFEAISSVAIREMNLLYEILFREKIRSVELERLKEFQEGSGSSRKYVGHLQKQLAKRFEAQNVEMKRELQTSTLRDKVVVKLNETDKKIILDRYRCLYKETHGGLRDPSVRPTVAVRLDESKVGIQENKTASNMKEIQEQPESVIEFEIDNSKKEVEDLFRFGGLCLFAAFASYLIQAKLVSPYMISEDSSYLYSTFVRCIASMFFVAIAHRASGSYRERRALGGRKYTLDLKKQVFRLQSRIAGGNTVCDSKHLKEIFNYYNDLGGGVNLIWGEERQPVLITIGQLAVMDHFEKLGASLHHSTSQALSQASEKQEAVKESVGHHGLKTSIFFLECVKGLLKTTEQERNNAGIDHPVTLSSLLTSVVSPLTKSNNNKNKQSMLDADLFLAMLEKETKQIEQQDRANNHRFKKRSSGLYEPVPLERTAPVQTREGMVNMKWVTFQKVIDDIHEIIAKRFGSNINSIAKHLDVVAKHETELFDWGKKTIANLVRVSGLGIGRLYVTVYSMAGGRCAEVVEAVKTSAAYKKSAAFAQQSGCLSCCRHRTNQDDDVDPQLATKKNQ